jgi:hypothetical protein
MFHDVSFVYSKFCQSVLKGVRERRSRRSKGVRERRSKGVHERRSKGGTWMAEEHVMTIESRPLTVSGVTFRVYWNSSIMTSLVTCHHDSKNNKRD